MNVLIICAHPDDEVLGCGGTIVKHIANHDSVFICFVTEGATSQYSESNVSNLRRQYAVNAADRLGVEDLFFLDFPDIMLDTISQVDIVRKLRTIIDKIKPDIIYTHDGDDINSDHRIVHHAALVLCRPLQNPKLKKVLFYEIFGSTLGFHPDYYVVINDALEKKISAMKEYITEIKVQTRSVDTIMRQAAYRGAEINQEFAEGFRLYRIIEY